MKKAFLFALLTGMILVSCKKSVPGTGTDTGTTTPTPGDDGTVVSTNVIAQHGWLKFATLKDFKATMTQLHNFPLEKLKDWDGKFAEFESLRKKYELLDADENDERSTPGSEALMQRGQLLDCPDSRFATVLSSSGRIQIADTLYVFPADQFDGKSYAVPERYIEPFLKGQDVFKMDGVATRLTSFIWSPFPRWLDGNASIVDPSHNFGICNFPNNLLINWWGQKGEDLYADNNNNGLPQHNGRTVKLNYHRWRVGYGFYSSVGVRVKMWKNTRLAGWLSNVKFKEASLEACANGIVLQHAMISVPFSSRIGPGVTRNNDNAFEHTLHWSADPVFTLIFLHHFNFKFKVNYEGHTIERFIRE